MRRSREPSPGAHALAAPLALLLALPVTVGCGEQTPEAAPAGASTAAPAATADLAADAVAKVGSRTITAGSVQRIAAAQAIPNAEARSRAMRDALFAEEARARGSDATSAETAALARALATELRREAEGPVSDAELERVTERHWHDLRRPEAFRVVHAVVLAPKRSTASGPADEATWARLEKLAGEIHAATAPASTRARAEPAPAGAEDPAVAEFRRVVSGVPTEGLDLRVELLDPVAADGRTLGHRGSTLVAEFATAAASLQARGDRTAPFRTAFGVHVALLLERIPRFEVPAEERRALLAAEVLDDRIRAARSALLAAGAQRVELAPNTAALLDLVRVQP